MNIKDLTKDLTQSDKDFLEIEYYITGVFDKINEIKVSKTIDEDDKDELIEECYIVLDKINDLLNEEYESRNILD